MVPGNRKYGQTETGEICCGVPELRGSRALGQIPRDDDGVRLQVTRQRQQRFQQPGVDRTKVKVRDVQDTCHVLPLTTAALVGGRITDRTW